MAAYSITVTNSINIFGLNPSDTWGQAIFPYTMTWGTTKWGEGTFPQVFSVNKPITNDLLPDTDIVKSYNKVITDSLTMLSDPSSEKLSVGVWNVVFASDTIEAEDRDFPTWAQSAAASNSFSCAAAGVTVWS